jgi:hypothetical protein
MNLPIWYGKKTFTVKTPFLFQGVMINIGQLFECSREDYLTYAKHFVEQEIIPETPEEPKEETVEAPVEMIEEVNSEPMIEKKTKKKRLFKKR